MKRKSIPPARYTQFIKYFSKGEGGHMIEHAMVASDYAIKTIGLITNNDIDAITKERKWQLNELNKLKNIL